MRSLHLQPYSLLSETFDWIIEKLHSYECIVNSASLHNTRINISQKFIIILSNIISTINQSINYNLPPAWLDNGTSPWRPKHGLFLTDHCYPLLNEFRWGRVSFSLERKKNLWVTNGRKYLVSVKITCEIDILFSFGICVTEINS